MKYIILLVVILIIVMIVFDNFINSRTNPKGRKELQQFAQKYNLQSGSGVFEGTYHDRDFRLISSGADWESNIHNIATMQISISKKLDASFTLLIRPDWEKYAHLHEQGFYKEVVDISIQPKIVHKVDIDAEEIETKQLFKLQSSPNESLEKIFAQNPQLKYKIIELDSMQKEINNYSPTYKLETGQLQIEFCYRNMILDELEIVANNLSNFATAIENFNEQVPI